MIIPVMKMMMPVMEMMMLRLLMLVRLTMKWDWRTPFQRVNKNAEAEHMTGIGLAENKTSVTLSMINY